MKNLSVLEESYKKFTANLDKWLPEGIIDIDLELLRKFGLLNFFKNSSSEEALTRYFNVIESEDKITLVNEHFVVWIVPENIEDIPTTYTLIAINDQDHPHLEMAFSTTGVYNTSRIVLRILEKFLMEIQETEDFLKRLKKSA